MPGSPMSRSTTSGPKPAATSSAAGPVVGDAGPRAPAAAGAWPGCRAASTLSSTTRTRAAGPRPVTGPSDSAAGGLGGSGRPGRRTTNSLPRARAVAVGLDRAAVQLDQPLDQRQADARARPATRSSDAVHLGEQLEDARAACPAGCRRRCRAPRTTASSPVRAGRSARCGRPSSVYLAALLSRLRPPGPAGPGRRPRRTGSAGSDTVSSCRRPRSAGRLVSTAPADHAGQVDRLRAAARSCRG